MRDLIMGARGGSERWAAGSQWVAVERNLPGGILDRWGLLGSFVGTFNAGRRQAEGSGWDGGRRVGRTVR